MALSTRGGVPIGQERAKRVRVYLALLEQAERGLADVSVGRTSDARETLRRLRRKRAR